MAGVLTRVGLDELYGPAVLGATSSTEGQTFHDWFANAWGSFAMGFLVPMRQSPLFARPSSLSHAARLAKVPNGEKPRATMWRLGLSLRLHSSRLLA
jgi:hypothetical protein